jgi:zinc protease
VKRLPLIAPLCLASLAITGTAPAGTAKTASKPALKLPDIQRFTLDNGLQVAFMQSDTAPSVTVELWYHAGSKDEPRDRRGSAHMFEHIMFKGSEHVKPEAHAQLINSLGGYVNAHTTEDATTFYETLPADYLDFALKLEAERMRNLLFRKDTIDSEREVVKEEIRDDENDPSAVGFKKLLAAMFTKHPYGWEAGGTIADLDNTTPDDLKKFYDTYYQPNNALLVVVGDVTLETLKASVEKNFGSIPKADDPPRPAKDSPEPAQTEKRRQIVDGAQIGVVFAGWHIPEAKHADIYALQVLSLILGAGESSRLQIALTDIDKKTKKPIGLGGGSQALLREDPGVFIAGGAFRTPAQQDGVESVILSEVAKLGTKGVTADELKKAKNQIQAAFVFGLESTNGMAEQIGESWILTGDPTQFEKDLDAFEKVTADDLKRVAKTYLTEDKMTEVIIPVATEAK